MNCNATPNGATSDWIGIDGASPSAPTLFQAGTASNCNSGQQSNNAWWTDNANGLIARPVFNVSPGDVIVASLYQANPGSWVYNLKDQTSGAMASATEAYDGSDSTAEWIVEDPTDGGTNSLFPLPPFGQVTFTDLSLTVPGGSWNLPNYNDAIAMARTDGSIEALPSQIQGTGSAASFTVTYQPEMMGSQLHFGAAIRTVFPALRFSS